MKQGLIKEELNNSLNDLVGLAFVGNRLLDRQNSVLGVKFVMNNTVRFYHQKVAHKFPLLADQISDFQDSRNNLTVYPETPLDATDYASPLDCFVSFLNYMIDFENSVKEVIQEAEEIDLMTAEFLRKFLLNLRRYTSQAILLVDKAELYKNNWMDFDRDIKKFFILGDEA